MQPTSRAWRYNQRQKLREESFVEITIILADIYALEDATPTDNGAAPFANTAQITDGLDKTYTAYASLEHNQWSLDGTRRLLNMHQDTGFVSNVMSDDETAFPAHPLITTSFSRVFEDKIPGVTIAWSTAFDEWATDFIVRAYTGGELTARKTVTGNTDAISEVEVDIANYDRIEVEVLKWCLPYRRARIEVLLIGMNQIYRKGDLFGFRHKMIADPLSASLPKYSIAYEVNNTDDEFDPNNLQGKSKYLAEHQKVVVRYGYRLDGEIEWISGGVYYLNEWRAPQNGLKAKFGARDILEFLGALYSKGVYRPNGISMYELAEQVLTDVVMPLNPDGNVNWYIHDKLKDIYTTAPLPIKSHASCLKLIAVASCCCLSFDRTGRIRIEPAAIATFIGHSEASDNGAAHFANTAQIVDGQDKDYRAFAMLEHNQWLLCDEEQAETDGFIILPDDEWGDTGYVSSALCDDEGVFDAPPKVTLTFPRIHTGLLSEIPIVWSETYNEYATDFAITAYGADRFGEEIVVAQHTVTGNEDVRCLVYMDIQNYNRIEIEMLKWCLPHRRARIEEIPSLPDYEINHFNSYLRPETRQTSPLAGIDVKTYSYFPGANTGELFRGTRRITGTQTITLDYSGAAINVSAVVTGGTLNQSRFFTFACELTITANGNVGITLTGNPLELSNTTYTLDTGERGNHRLPVENPLITTTEQAQNVAEWAADYLRSRMLVEVDWRADPRLDVLDAVMVENKFGFRPLRMTSIEFTYSGGFRGTGEGRVILE